MPIDRTRPRSDGFTLIETIIVLVVLGLALGLVIAHGPMRSPAVVLRSAATSMVEAMRAARSQAIATDHAADLTLTEARTGFRVGDGRIQKLPRGMTARLALGTRTASALRFLPDGSTGGGTVVLRLGARRATITLDWLSGRIDVAMADQAPTS